MTTDEFSTMYNAKYTKGNTDQNAACIRRLHPKIQGWIDLHS